MTDKAVNRIKISQNCISARDMAATVFWKENWKQSSKKETTLKKEWHFLSQQQEVMGYCKQTGWLQEKW